MSTVLNKEVRGKPARQCGITLDPIHRLKNGEGIGLFTRDLTTFEKVRALSSPTPVGSEA
jgi:hypothetical protein